jgi:DNA-binding NarL/FixJ family response regulator
MIELPSPWPERLGFPVLRILLVDDHAVLRRGVEAIISRNSLGTVCGEASDGEEAVRLAKKLKPDVIVMDVGMPKLSGIDATRQIRSFDPGVKIIMLTMHDVSQLGGILAAGGADRVIEKISAEEQLAGAIRELTNRPK